MVKIRRRFVNWFILSAFSALSAAAAPATVTQESLPERVEFNRDIRPILSDKCFTCHGPDEAQRTSPLRFDSEDAAYVDLASGGKAIVRGDPANSKMVQRISSDDPSIRMPPAYMGHDKLSGREIALITRWIEQGAEWQKHWSFIPPKKPQLPAIRNKAWPKNPIDYFVLRRLEREGLEPSQEAERATLIRRVALDLTGLPPTLEELDRFLSDTSPNAYEKAVDHYLESPRYGERMAYRWLDAARYADTNGYQNDRERYMWRWRDWVIDAFNSNKPFDEFTIEQIAGDMLPNATRKQKIATGFNRNHRGNGELGIVPEEYHVEYVVDRVEATSTVWLGLTMGCARCHDHKYDPITQKEFYKLYAFFNNVPDRGRYFKYGNTPPIVKAPTEEQQAELDALDAKIEAAREEFKELQPEAAEAQSEWEKELAEGGKYVPWAYETRLLHRFPLEGEDGSPGDREALFTAGKLGRAAQLGGERYIELGDRANFSFFDKFTLSAWINPESDTGGIVTRMRPSASARGNKGYGLYLEDGKLRARMESTDIDDRMIVETKTPVQLGRWSHVAMTYDGSRLAKGFRLYVNSEPQELHVIKDHSNNDTKIGEPLRIGHGPGSDDHFQGLIDDVRIYRRALSKAEIGVIATPESIAEIAAIAPKKRTRGQTDKLRWAFLHEYAPGKIRAAWRELQQLRLEREDLVDSFPTVMVMKEMQPPRETFVLKRGAYDAPSEKVSPGVPSVLLQPGTEPPTNRLEFARWLVDPSNPLTSRVTINRFWQMFFGTGLVKSVENFGSQGEWPTHPELLDWLAVEFMESGWDVKGIIKTMLMSATYRQSSKIRPELQQKDPQNRLLARAPRVRLPAETVRDQALAIAGLLVDKQGGPSVRPYQPAGLWKELSNWGAYEHDQGDELYRRSLYTFWKRTIAPPAMVTFDAAPRETCIVRETRTNTPLQALNLMNDVTYAEAARLFAERMMKEGGETPAERLAWGFRLATAREPEAQEREILLNSFHRYSDRYQTDPEDARRYLSTGEHPRDESLPAAEHAAYTAVASLILNLDETITKE